MNTLARKLTMVFVLLACLTPAVAQDIVFASDTVRQICVAHWDRNGDGELSLSEAAAVTDLDTTFSNLLRKQFSFDELQHFTGLRSIGDKAFSDCYRMSSVTIPASVDTIGEKAFWSCINIKQVRLPKTLHVLRKACFYHCEELERISIPGTVDTIPELAFAWCKNMREVVVNGGCRTVGRQAFANCESIQYVTLPSMLTFIGREAFFIPASLRTILVQAATPPVAEEGAFSDYAMKNAILYVPSGSLEAYRKAPVWRNFKYISEYF